ncbi:MAG: MotA/TolQ/ExbB proton channel family protein, partial [Verrucomicrobia bacterium]|nr:MotA/TolQ/ExbB proton channel family protein [Verrucomicrobiota bacterium]
TALGFIKMFAIMEQEGQFAHAALLSGGVWQALVCTAMGLAVAIPSYVGYNYLVGRVNQIVLDMERSSNEILNLVTGESVRKP